MRRRCKWASVVTYIENKNYKTYYCDVSVHEKVEIASVQATTTAVEWVPKQKKQKIRQKQSKTNLKLALREPNKIQDRNFV